MRKYTIIIIEVIGGLQLMVLDETTENRVTGIAKTDRHIPSTVKKMLVQLKALNETGGAA